MEARAKTSWHTSATSRRADDLGPVHLAERLMAETDPEGRQVEVAAHRSGQRLAHPTLRRSTRPRRHQQMRRLMRPHLRHRDLVIADHLHLSAEFEQILDEVVREGIVVIDDQHQPAITRTLLVTRRRHKSSFHGSPRAACRAMSRATCTADAFL